MTIYESNPEVRPTGAEIAEFVDAPGPASPVSGPRDPARTGPGADTPPYLRIYLNDHRAGAAAGLALARRCEHNNRGSALGEELQFIVRDLRADEASLHRIVRHLRLPENRFKQAAARAGELFGRLKLNGEVRRYSPLSRLLELEMLLAGIDAKRSLWHALHAAGIDVPPDIDLKQLEDRASHQRARLRPHHLEAGRQALASRDAHSA